MESDEDGDGKLESIIVARPPGKSFELFHRQADGSFKSKTRTLGLKTNMEGAELSMDEFFKKLGMDASQIRILDEHRQRL